MSNHVLKEEVDYKWLEKDTGYGIIPTFPKLTNGAVLKRITTPRSGDTVLLSGNDTLRPVRIISGEYESNGRTSNFWKWHEINEDNSLGKIESGYGFFYEYPPTI